MRKKIQKVRAKKKLGQHFLKDINITDESGQTYRFVIRYNNQEDDLYIYDPKVVNQLIYANRKEKKWTF